MAGKSSRAFEIEKYVAQLGHVKKTDKPECGGIIECYSKKREFSVRVYFVLPGASMKNKTSEDCLNGRIVAPMEQWPFYIDLLRNERPVYCALDRKNPDLNYIGTYFEPVGEGEQA